MSVVLFPFSRHLSEHCELNILNASQLFNTYVSVDQSPYKLECHKLYKRDTLTGGFPRQWLVLPTTQHWQQNVLVRGTFAVLIGTSNGRKDARMHVGIAGVTALVHCSRDETCHGWAAIRTIRDTIRFRSAKHSRYDVLGLTRNPAEIRAILARDALRDIHTMASTPFGCLRRKRILSNSRGLQSDIRLELTEHVETSVVETICTRESTIWNSFNL